MRITWEEWRKLPPMRFASFENLETLYPVEQYGALLSWMKPENGPPVVMAIAYRRRDFYRPVIRVPMGRAQ